MFNNDIPNSNRSKWNLDTGDRGNANWNESEAEKDKASELDKLSHLHKDTYRSKSNYQSSRKIMPIVDEQQENIGDAEANGDEEEGKKKGGLNALFGGMLSGLNDNIGDVEGPAKDNWQFCVFQIRKRKYNILKNGISSKLNIPLGPGDESLIM